MSLTNISSRSLHYVSSLHKILTFLLSFLAPPAERQLIFSNADLLVVRLSIRLSLLQSRLRGRGQSQKCFSNFFFFFGMKLLWEHINHISKDRFGWIALKALGGHLVPNCSLTFCIELHSKGTNELPLVVLKCCPILCVPYSFIGMMLILS